MRWIDSRREAFPAHAPANVALIHAPEPAAELASAPDGALIVVMTHSHALDLEIVAEALGPSASAIVGLIGSATKRARFLSQMRAAGLTEASSRRLVCPIGVPGIEGKDPAVIAASTAAQLLIVSEKLAAEEPGRSPQGAGTVRRLRRPERIAARTGRLVSLGPDFGGSAPLYEPRRLRATRLALAGALTLRLPLGLRRSVADARASTSAPFDFRRSPMRPTSSSARIAGRPSERAIA